MRIGIRDEEKLNRPGNIGQARIAALQEAHSIDSLSAQIVDKFCQDGIGIVCGAIHNGCDVALGVKFRLNGLDDLSP
jgi:hypothetical protein